MHACIYAYVYLEAYVLVCFYQAIYAQVWHECLFLLGLMNHNTDLRTEVDNSVHAHTQKWNYTSLQVKRYRYTNMHTNKYAFVSTCVISFDSCRACVYICTHAHMHTHKHTCIPLLRNTLWLPAWEVHPGLPKHNYAQDFQLPQPLQHRHPVFVHAVRWDVVHTYKGKYVSCQDNPSQSKTVRLKKKSEGGLAGMRA